MEPSSQSTPKTGLKESVSEYSLANYAFSSSENTATKLKDRITTLHYSIFQRVGVVAVYFLGILTGAAIHATWSEKPGEWGISFLELLNLIPPPI